MSLSVHPYRKMGLFIVFFTLYALQKIYIRSQEFYIRFAENFYTVRNKFVTVYKFIFIRKEIYGQPYIIFQAPFTPSFTCAPLSATSSPPFLLNGYFIFFLSPPSGSTKLSLGRKVYQYLMNAMNSFVL